jgi:pSer/pThr/pTyr-binding forkhead associated (FHA) protein
LGIRTRWGAVSCKYRSVDVGSLNGAYVNGEPIDAAMLTNGDEIEMGKFRLQVLTGPATGLTP